MQVYKIVKEGLKDEAPAELVNLNNKPPDTLIIEEMQVWVEKLEEDLHIIRVDDEYSILCAKDLNPRKDEKSSPTKTNVKKIFIRSRLYRELNLQSTRGSMRRLKSGGAIREPSSFKVGIEYRRLLALENREVRF
ncbi:unnamed protein product [Lactuca saligna]|uniref:Uncharacterized protein n=1 Tax=Lactuca saligna TaxID=75948 RepID=A0AA35ZE70_LACSI|nr:unnamed protein product [Lactuca saligna]